jgi:type VI protein secretion system component VasF
MAKNGSGRAPLAEWRGNVTATLEGLTTEVAALAARVEKIDKEQSVIATKIAIYGGFAGAAVGGAAHYLLKALGA